MATFGESKRASTVKSRCSRCKEPRIECDETLPTCRRCQHTNVFTDPTTLMRSNAPHSENPQQIELTWVENSSPDTGHAHILGEANKPIDVENWIQERPGQDTKIKRQPGGQDRCDSLTGTGTKRSRRNKVGEDEYPSSALLSEASGSTPQADGMDYQVLSNKDCSEQKAGTALLKVDANCINAESRTTDPRIEPNYVSLYTRSSDGVKEHSTHTYKQLSSAVDRDHHVELSTQSRSLPSDDPGPLRSVTQGTDHNNLFPVSLHTGIGAGNFQTSSAWDCPNAGHGFSTDDPRITYIWSSNVAMPKNHQGPLSTQPSSYPYNASPQPQSTYQPPAVTFTIDNRIESTLSPTTTKSLLELFSKNCQVLVTPKKKGTRQVYSGDVIIYQCSPDLHNWYMAETGTAEVPALRVELFDANWKFENAFLIPGGNLYSLQMLKQFIWDFFWVSWTLGSEPATIKIMIRTAQQAFNGMDPTSMFTSFGPTTHEMTLTHPKTMPNNYTPQTNPSAFKTDYINRATLYSERYHSYKAPIYSTWTNLPLQYAFQLRGPNSHWTAPASEIIVRLQTDGTGKVSPPHNQSVLRQNITAAEFFTWFASQTGRGGKGPPCLRFTLKDAMPAPKSSMVAQTNEDHFNLMRKDIEGQLEHAKIYTPGLKEFTVLVTDPGWHIPDLQWDREFWAERN